MILLKKPYKPLMFTGLSASYNVYGKSFMKLQAVYLSGAPLSGTTFHNPFSAVPKLSARFPGFTAYKLPFSEYTTNFDNTITIKVPAPVQAGFIDVIAQNPAGYGALTQFVIRELYTGEQPVSALRPWSFGINVLSGVEIPPVILPSNLIYTLNSLSALQTFNGEGIITFVIGLSDQMYSINNDTILTIQGDNIVEI